MNRKSKYNLCTFFNRNYLFKGLAQYKSLEKTSKDFMLWILCVDDITYEILDKLNLKQAKLVKIEDVETKELLSVKGDRSEAEYCWTVKPTFMEYIFKRNHTVKTLLYVDSDIGFFDDVRKVFNETKGYSIGVASHDFPENMKERVKGVGKFNAGVVYFKRDKESIACLKKWKAQCIDWCYWRLEDGKLGDQMYLNEWPKVYQNIKIFSHKGINLAPWNVKKYKLHIKKNKVFVENDPLIFFHFHQFKILSGGKYERSHGYKLSKNIVELIYKPYEKLIRSSVKEIRKPHPKFTYGIEQITLIEKLRAVVTKALLNFYWVIKTRFR